MGGVSPPVMRIPRNDAAVRLVFGRFLACCSGLISIGLKTFFEPLADPGKPVDRGYFILWGVFDRACILFNAIT